MWSSLGPCSCSSSAYERFSEARVFRKSHCGCSACYQTDHMRKNLADLESGKGAAAIAEHASQHKSKAASPSKEGLAATACDSRLLDEAVVEELEAAPHKDLLVVWQRPRRRVPTRLPRWCLWGTRRPPPPHQW